MDTPLAKKHSIKFSTEAIAALINLPEGFEIYDIIGNFDRTFSLVIHRIGDPNHSYQLVESDAKLIIRRTEDFTFQDLMEWKNWDIQ